MSLPAETRRLAHYLASVIANIRREALGVAYATCPCTHCTRVMTTWMTATSDLELTLSALGGRLEENPCASA